MAASFWEADISDSRTLSYLAFFFNESSYPKSANFRRSVPFRGFNFSWPLAGRMNGFFKNILHTNSLKQVIRMKHCHLEK